jgi:hypothetical protein
MNAHINILPQHITTHLVYCLEVGSRLDQALHYIQMTLHGSPHQCCVSILHQLPWHTINKHTPTPYHHSPCLLPRDSLPPPPSSALHSDDNSWKPTSTLCIHSASITMAHINILPHHITTHLVCCLEVRSHRRQALHYIQKAIHGSPHQRCVSILHQLPCHT